MTIRLNKAKAALLGAGLAVTLLSGCASPQKTLYYWGDYPNQQYAYFKGDKGPEDAILSMEKTREDAKAQGRALPPGFSAHLGLLYGQTGRTDLFEQNLLAEQKQFPESASYINFLLKKKTTVDLKADTKDITGKKKAASKANSKATPKPEVAQ